MNTPPTPPAKGYPIYPSPAGCQLVHDGLDLLGVLLEDIVRMGFDANRKDDKLAKLLAEYVPRMTDSLVPLLAHRLDRTSYYANTWRLNDDYYDLLFRLACTHFLVKQGQNYAHLDLDWQGEVRYWLGTATPGEALNGPCVDDCFLVLGKHNKTIYIKRLYYFQYILLGCRSQRIFIVDEYCDDIDSYHLECCHFYEGTLCLYPGVTPFARGVFKPKQALTYEQALKLQAPTKANSSTSSESAAKSAHKRLTGNTGDQDNDADLDLLSLITPKEFLSPKLLPHDFAISRASPAEQKVLKARYKRAKKELEGTFAALLPADLKLPVFTNLNELQKASAQCFAQNPLVRDFYGFVDKVKVSFKPRFTQVQPPEVDEQWGKPANIKVSWRLVDEQGNSLQGDLQEYEGFCQQLKLVNLGLDQAHTVLLRLPTRPNHMVHLRGLILDGVFYGL